ncbi:PREDICTED: kalirin-like [Cariama cristata]|uniref:kalirin-like n=1 Tax=Cariama cristata TaxID=54380 RepID=UPI00052022E5|nr:PREDICTED: kalirin-like [Cariama cristata]
MSVASRLSEAGHYASQQIKQISSQLDQEWKSFAAALDERSTILAMSAVFHQKAEQFLSGVDAWCKMCSEGGLPSEMQDLELAIHHHQTLYEQVTQAYTEVCAPLRRMYLLSDNRYLTAFWSLAFLNEIGSTFRFCNFFKGVRSNPRL